MCFHRCMATKFTFNYCCYMLVALLFLCPPVFAAPSVETVAQKYKARVGEAFPVEYRIAWEGDASAYAVLPPELPALDWGEATLLETRTSTKGSVSETRLVIGFKATQSGHFEVPALSIRIIPLEGEEHSFIKALPEDLATQIVTTTPVTLTFFESRVPTVIVAVLLVLLTCLGVGYGFLRKRARKNQASLQMPPRERCQELIHRARQARLDGDFYAFYTCLYQICELVSQTTGERNKSFQVRIETLQRETGYKGFRPSDDDVDGDFKQVEQIAASLLRHS